MSWRTFSTATEPLLWVLHLDYGWLVVGLVLKALWLLADVELAAGWLHAFTVGAFSTMILALMSGRHLGAPDGR